MLTMTWALGTALSGTPDALKLCNSLQWLHHMHVM